MTELHEHVEAYAIGALSEDEATEFARHLADCADCQDEMAALTAVTSALAGTVAADPPPALRAAVLAEIARTPQETPAAARAVEVAPLLTSPTVSPSATAAPPAAEGPADGSNVIPMRRSRTNLVTSLLAAAAIVAAVGFGGWALQSRQDAQVATATANQLTQLLSADDVQTVPGVSQSADHTGAIVMSRSAGKALFVADELPSLPSDKVYEAWTIRGSSDPVPAGTFRPNASSQVITALPAGAFQADSVAITVEPKGGTDHPTSDAVVTFVMPQA